MNLDNPKHKLALFYALAALAGLLGLGGCNAVMDWIDQPITQQGERK